MRLGHPQIYIGLLLLSATAYLMYRELSIVDAILNTPLASPADVQAALTDVMQNLAMYGLGGFATYVLMVSVLGLIINHRVAGPTHAIVTTLEEYLKGNFSYRRQLRANDELKPIQKRLNRLGAALTEKEAQQP